MIQLFSHFFLYIIRSRNLFLVPFSSTTIKSLFHSVDQDKKRFIRSHHGQDRSSWWLRRYGSPRSTTVQIWNSSNSFPPELAREVIDVLVAVNKHEITILSRDVSRYPNTPCYNLFIFLLTNLTQEASASSIPRVTWRTVNYSDKNDLVEALQGIHTVLSFVNQPVVADHENNSQKILIDACIVAGVKRFAPSEYGWYVARLMLYCKMEVSNCVTSDEKQDLPFWAGKMEIKSYLQSVNANGKVSSVINLPLFTIHPFIF